MMSKQKHNEYLQTLFSQIKHLPVFTGVRLFVTGSTIDHAEFYELVESCGGLIIGEDHDLGSRNFSNITKNSERNLIEDIVLRYQVRRPTSAKATITERVESVVKQVQETAAQGVIFIFTKRMMLHYGIIHSSVNACKKWESLHYD